MIIKKTCVVPWISLFLIGMLAGCGGTGSASLDASNSNSNSNNNNNNNSAILASISITPANPALAVNTDQQCLAAGIFSDNTTRDITSEVTWTTSDADAVDVVAGAEATSLTASPALDPWKANTIYIPGKISAKHPGHARITARWGSISGSTDVTVTSATLVSIMVTPTNPSIAPGTTRQFMATGTFSDNTTQDLTTTVTWGSSAAFVAAISNAACSNGLCSSVAAGSTTITATSGIVSGSTTLAVTSATLVSITVTPNNPSIAKGTTQQFTATGTFSDNTIQNLTTAVTWASSAASVAAVSNAAGSKGVSVSIAAGSTTITAASGSISGTTTITVAEGGGAAAVTLSWDAPTTYTDGSFLNPLTDLSTYKIYYGTASHFYSQIVNVPNPGTTTIAQTLNLSAGTYYFAVTTVDAVGIESDYSNEVMKTI